MRRTARAARAAGVDLHVNWRDARYCAIDVETTGLDLRRDCIVSIGCAEIRGGRISCCDNYYSLIRPTSPLSAASMRIHCLRPGDLQDAPAAQEVGQWLARQLSGQIMVAHAAWIERAFLSKVLRQAGAKFMSPVIDTAALARALGLARSNAAGGEPSLELLARQLSLPVYQPHHALGDAMTTAVVFLAMAAKAGGTIRDHYSEPATALSLVRLSAEHAY